MAGVNKAILVGNLGRDPELRYTGSGTAVANFTLATTEKVKSKDSDGYEDRTEWHRIVAWGRTAELCAQYLNKGRSVYIEGRIQTREWEDKEGQKRRTTEVVANTVQFLGGRGQGQGDAGGGGGGRDFGSSGGGQGGGGQRSGGQGGGPESGGSDDIPF